MFRSFGRRLVAVGGVVALAGALSTASAVGQTDEGDETDPEAAAEVVASVPGERVFDYTGDKQTFTVPHGVTEIEVWAGGAEGGDGSSCSFVTRTTDAIVSTEPCAAEGSGGEGAIVEEPDPRHRRRDAHGDRRW